MEGGGCGKTMTVVVKTSSISKESPKGLLEEFGINVTRVQRGYWPCHWPWQGGIRVIEILNRRTKNNPVLIGEPGVGKTAVVEGWLKIVGGSVPHKLQGKEVIRLERRQPRSGRRHPWSIRRRMQGVMDEIRQREDVILFIDEIHEIVGWDVVRAIWTLKYPQTEPWRVENSN